MKYLYLTQFASSEYNCGAYSAGSYSEGACQTSAGDGSTSTPGGVTGDIAGTGMNVILPLVLGLLLIAGSAIYFIRAFRKRNQLKATKEPVSRR